MMTILHNFRNRIPSVLAVFLLLSATIPPVAVQAAPGLPDSTGFGYGTQINPEGEDLELALNVAASLGLDWISVELDWSRTWTSAAGGPDLSRIGRVMEAAGQRDLSVLLVLNSAPEWATTPSGPDPAVTAQFVNLLARLYPEVLDAIELFPGANSTAWWGAVPDPGSYADLYRTCLEVLADHPNPPILVSGGLWTGEPAQPGDLKDTAFLAGLYHHGAAEWLPVVGLRLNIQSGEITTLPTPEHPSVLRYYEVIRQVMVANGHANGLLWITAFNWPPAAALPRLAEEEAQVEWTLEAYHSLRSQLYIGAAFFGCLNPPVSRLNSGEQQCLITSGSAPADSRLHPILLALGERIARERHAHSLIIEPSLFTKQRPRTSGAWTKP